MGTHVLSGHIHDCFNGLFMKAYSILFVLLLLFRCGDIEMNPGPLGDDTIAIESNADSIIDSFFNNTFCKIIHLNVLSLLTCHEQISVEFNDYDIIALSKTFLNDTVTDDDIFISGYDKVFRMDRNRHGGGVCVYVKYAERCVDFEDCRLECIWLKVRYINTTFYFACRPTYRPPNSGNDFWQLLCDSVGRVKDNNDNPNIFICGDLNSDLYKP